MFLNVYRKWALKVLDLYIEYYMNNFDYSTMPDELSDFNAKQLVNIANIIDKEFNAVFAYVASDLRRIAYNR